MSPRRAGGNDASSACKDAAAGRSRRRAWRLERAVACVEAALARTRPETQIATFTQARGDAFGPRPCAPRASRAGSRPAAEKNRSESGRTSLGRGHGTDSARDARLAGRARAPERRRRERHRLGSSEGRHGACSRRVRWEVCGGPRCDFKKTVHDSTNEKIAIDSKKYWRTPLVCGSGFPRWTRRTRKRV